KAVILYLLPADHLRARDEPFVEAVELVPDQVAVDEGNGRRGPHGIGVGEIGLRYVAQNASRLRKCRPGKHGGGSGCGRLQELTALHWRNPPRYLCGV